MSIVKQITVKKISSSVANEFIKKTHYSGKVVPNSCLHFGCFLGQRLHGVLSYGPPMDKRKTITIVEGTGWNEMLELNRMAFDNYLPKNSESRCIAISIRLIKKNAPHIKWILSFSDGTVCGDGTIYRASGFALIGIKKNTSQLLMPDGTIKARKTLDNLTDGRNSSYWRKKGAKPIEGFQLKYVHIIDKSAKLKVPILPFSEIDKCGAGMYRGETISMVERASRNRTAESLQEAKHDATSSDAHKHNIVDAEEMSNA